jgi:uncharacterized protein
MRRYLAVLTLLLLGLSAAHALTGIPETPVGHIADGAKMLGEQDQQSLESTLRTFSDQTGIEIVVATTPSLDGGSIETEAVKLFESWQLGNKEKDMGVLLLIAKENRQARIEVGYGLEGALPDTIAYRILQEDLFPAFKEDRYADGIAATVARIQSVTQGEALPQEANRMRAQVDWFSIIFIFGFMALQLVISILERSKSWWLGGVLGFVTGGMVTLVGFWGITLLVGSILTGILTLSGLVLDYVVSKGYIPGKKGGDRWNGPFIGGGSWGGGSSSGGGFGGFGGGSSGGGGASGSW